ncbi:MAG: hypothetical protein DRP46_02095 [Candidatus Zixiibacteriota bacterium]|nr:MAG: hypothetical protein DRP46_02095 [candidate division Zixibacteria bacterium]
MNMQSKKRLLIITNRYPAGPDDVASPFVHDFRKALEADNIQTDVVTPYYQSQYGGKDYIDDAVHVFRWSDGSRVISQLPLYHPASILKIKRYFQRGYETAAKLLNRNKYDGILALWAAPSGYIAERLSEKYDIPFAVWALGSDINSWAQLPIVGKIIVKVLKNSHRLYADGYELAVKVKALAGKECQFIPSYHAIEIDAVRPEIPAKGFVCVGRVEKSKGVFDLLEAFRIFVKRHSDYRLDYIGTGRAETQLKKMIEEYHLSNSVASHGYLPRCEINELLVNSTAAVIPSHADSLPLTFGEAMQAGVPVICSDVGDMPYFVDRYKAGYHYPAGDVGALAEKMEEILAGAAQCAANCQAALSELDICNSVMAIRGWLETIAQAIETKECSHADA